jgi:hypothetical protein
MSLLIQNRITVQLLQNEMNLLAKEYLSSVEINQISRYLPKDRFDKENLIYGLWYYFAIFVLSSKTAHTIWAYEHGDLTLEEILDGKIWILQNWSKESLFHDFNDYIKKQMSLIKLRKSWHTQSSLNTFSVDGRDLLLKLHNDEKIEIYRRLITLEAVSEMDKNEYQERISELRENNNKKSLDIIIDNVKADPTQYKQLVIRYEQIAETDKKFYKRNGNINITEIARYIKSINPRKLKLRTIEQALFRYRKEIGKI